MGHLLLGEFGQVVAKDHRRLTIALPSRGEELMLRRGLFEEESISPLSLQVCRNLQGRRVPYGVHVDWSARSSRVDHRIPRFVDFPGQAFRIVSQVLGN